MTFSKFMFFSLLTFALWGTCDIFAQTDVEQMSAHDIEIRTNSVECAKFFQTSLRSGISANALIYTENQNGVINGEKMFLDLTLPHFTTNNFDKAHLRICQFNEIIHVVTGLRTFEWNERTLGALEHFLADLKRSEDKNMNAMQRHIFSDAPHGSQPLDEQNAHFRRNVEKWHKYMSFQDEVKRAIREITQMMRRRPVPLARKNSAKLSVIEAVDFIDAHIMKPEVAANASRWIMSNVVYSADELLPCCCEMGSVTNDNPWEAAAALRARCNTIAAVVSMPCSMNATNCQALTSFRNDVLFQVKPVIEKENRTKPSTPESHRARGEAFYQQMLRQVASELHILIRKFGDIAESQKETSP